MIENYIPRSIEKVLEKAASEFPAIVLTGPRQAGKTTLLKKKFSRACGYVSLEPPDIRAAAMHDPRGFLDLHPPPVIFDEVQHATDLLPYIKEAIDAHRDRSGQYFLTGSQNLLLMETVTESLAGRAAILRLLPLSYREENGKPHAPLPWEGDQSQGNRSKATQTDLWHKFLRGNYPELVANPTRDIGLWHSGYIQTYLERDVRTLRQVGDLTQFQNFLRALAARTAQLLSLTDIARDLGIAVNTVKAWLSVLEASYQVIILRPYHANVGKRLVKRPKIYFTDLGTLCHLTGLKDPQHAKAGPMGGPIMETAVLTEIFKTITHSGILPQLYFWRTASGNEIDIVVETGGNLVPIEVKLSSTPLPSMAKAIKIFQKDFPQKSAAGYVVHPGDVRLPLGPNVTSLPFAQL
jgi:hypothetical protein